MNPGLAIGLVVALGLLLAGGLLGVAWHDGAISATDLSRASRGDEVVVRGAVLAGGAAACEDAGAKVACFILQADDDDFVSAYGPIGMPPVGSSIVVEGTFETRFPGYVPKGGTLGWNATGYEANWSATFDAPLDYHVSTVRAAGARSVWLFS